MSQMWMLKLIHCKQNLLEGINEAAFDLWPLKWQTYLLQGILGCLLTWLTLDCCCCRSICPLVRNTLPGSHFVEPIVSEPRGQEWQWCVLGSVASYASMLVAMLSTVQSSALTLKATIGLYQWEWWFGSPYLCSHAPCNSEWVSPRPFPVVNGNSTLSRRHCSWPLRQKCYVWIVLCNAWVSDSSTAEAARVGEMICTGCHAETDDTDHLQLSSRGVDSVFPEQFMFWQLLLEFRDCISLSEYRAQISSNIGS